jgi:hypothetical protein
MSGLRVYQACGLASTMPALDTTAKVPEMPPALPKAQGKVELPRL